MTSSWLTLQDSILWAKCYLISPGQNCRHFVDDIFRCIFVNESFIFWLKFHWILFPRVQLTITQHCFDNGLALNMQQAIIQTNTYHIHWFIYAALGGDVSMSYSTFHPSHFFILTNVAFFPKIPLMKEGKMVFINVSCWSNCCFMLLFFVCLVLFVFVGAYFTRTYMHTTIKS